jgi:hypothetical protein
MRRKLYLLLLATTVIYGLGYSVARWRKFIVMREYSMKEHRLVVRRTGPGWDVRENWRGRLKNRANPILFLCFRPLCLLEDSVRGSTRSL